MYFSISICFRTHKIVSLVIHIL